MPWGFIDLYYSPTRQAYDVRIDLGKPNDYITNGFLCRMYSTKSLYWTTDVNQADSPVYYIDKSDVIYNAWQLDFRNAGFKVAQRGKQDSTSNNMRYYSHNTEKKHS